MYERRKVAKEEENVEKTKEWSMLLRRYWKRGEVGWDERIKDKKKKKKKKKKNKTGRKNE